VFKFPTPGFFMLDVERFLRPRHAAIKQIEVEVAVTQDTRLWLAELIEDGLCTVKDMLPSVENVAVTLTDGGLWSRRFGGALDSSAAAACKADLRAWFEGDGTVRIIWNDSSH